VASKKLESSATHVCLVTFVVQPYVPTTKRNLIRPDLDVVSMVLSSSKMMQVLRAGERHIDVSHGLFDVHVLSVTKFY
jgi:hypothetical protein